MWAVRIVPLWYSIWLTSAQRWWSESTFPPLTSSFSSMRTFHVMLHEIFHSFLYTRPLLLLKQEQHNFVIILLEHFQMALDTIQILGGNGYLNDYPAGWDEHKMNYFFDEILSYSRAISTWRQDLWDWGWNSRGEKHNLIGIIIHSNYNVVKDQWSGCWFHEIINGIIIPFFGLFFGQIFPLGLFQ